MSSVTYELVVTEVPSTCESQEDADISVRLIRAYLPINEYLCSYTVYEEKVKFSCKDEAIKRARFYAESSKRSQTPLLSEKL